MTSMRKSRSMRCERVHCQCLHELKTPIALIQGYAEGLCDGMCEDRRAAAITVRSSWMRPTDEQDGAPASDTDGPEFGNDTPSIETFDDRSWFTT